MNEYKFVSTEMITLKPMKKSPYSSEEYLSKLSL